MNPANHQDGAAPQVLRVAFIINDLDLGGAERMLLKVSSRLSPAIRPIVLSLARNGKLNEEFEAAGIPVTDLAISGIGSLPGGLWRGWKALRRFRPEVCNTWMYHADLIGGLLARAAGTKAVAWNIRNSNLDPSRSSLATRVLVRVNAMLSRRLPARIICCAQVAQRVHVEIGYDGSRFVHVPNGFDTDAFRPDAEARVAIRRELGIANDVPLIGLVARWHAQKDHRNFVRAATLLRHDFPQAHFMLVGQGCDSDNEILARWLSTDALTDHFHLLGPRTDIARLTAALDIATSSSASGEAFPNTLGEAMACGIPCVTTDVGDSGAVIGDTGYLVPAHDSHALANAWKAVLLLPTDERAKLGLAARERVEMHFDLNSIARTYESLFFELARGQKQCVV
ncbi:MAG: glycosyltransferase [Burkholderiaceae bacterium]